MIRYKIHEEEGTEYLIGDYIFNYYVQIDQFSKHVFKIKKSMKVAAKSKYKEMPWADFNLEDQVIRMIFSGKMEIHPIGGVA